MQKIHISVSKLNKKMLVLCKFYVGFMVV
jgi:hypothetical protein